MTSITDAVILAAGMGIRLGERGELTPKGFITLGDRGIIEESLSRLWASGIRRVVIVTGHQAEYYEHLRIRSGGFVHTIHNPLYARSGSMYSLYCAP